MGSESSVLLYGKTGGIFVGDNIDTDYQRNRLHTIIVSFTKPFEIHQKHYQQQTASSVLIPPNLEFRIKSLEDEPVVFVHISPYSEAGLKIENTGEMAILTSYWHARIQSILESCTENMDHVEVDRIISKVAEAISVQHEPSKRIDPRVLKCIKLIDEEELYDFVALAQHCSISLSRLSHLFKADTGITLKQYVQHRKVIKAIHGMHEGFSLTDSATYGGLSDQPHFTHVFRRMFGIKPSKVKK